MSSLTYVRRGVSMFVAGGVLLAVMLAPRGVQAQDTLRGPLAQMQQAVTAGNAQSLLTHAADRLEVAVLGSGRVYSREQAVYVMRDFFENHPPRRFVFSGSVWRDRNCFAEGRYRSQDSSQPLHVYLRIRKGEKQWTLHEIRISRGGSR